MNQYPAVGGCRSEVASRKRSQQSLPPAFYLPLRSGHDRTSSQPSLGPPSHSLLTSAMTLASSFPLSSLPALSHSPRSLHLVCSQVSFPSPRKPAGTGGPSVAPSPLPNEAALRWRTRVSFFQPFIKKKGKSREALKDELFEAIAPLDRGAEATPEDRERVDQV